MSEPSRALTSCWGLTFDEGFQPGESLIPLLGNEIEVLLHFFHRHGVKFETALAAYVDAMDNAGIFEDAQMLGDCLSREAGTTR